MKRLAVALAAALILLSVSTAAFAAPDEDSVQDSGSVSIQESVGSDDSSVSEETSSEETSSQSETSDDEISSANESSKKLSSDEEADNSDDSSDVSSAENSDSSVGNEKSSPAEKSESSGNTSYSDTAKKIDIDKIRYATYNIKNVNMFIDIPSDMYVLTPGISADSPALAAAGMTKSEAEKSLSESDTAIKAFSKDFSYDITVTMVKNSNSKQIGNLSSLDDKQMQKLMDSLLRNTYTKGCAKNKYNDVLFLTLNMEYSADDGTKIYGIQQYTVINDANIMVTIQSKNEPLSNDQRALFNKIMTSVFFDSVNQPQTEEETSSDISGTMIQELDRRYLLIIACSIIAAAALAGIIIVATKRRETIAAENPEPKDSNEFLKYYEDDDEEYYDDAEENDEDNSDENGAEDKELYSDSKSSAANAEKSEAKKLTSTAELAIPKNPYTPVGKAEAVAQPAMSVTSEIAKFSIINEQAKRLADEADKRGEKDDTVVFAESAPKAKTSIEQIGESVFKDNEEKPVSEYERKFGKNRADAAPKSYDLPKRNDDNGNVRLEKDTESAFEKRFGKVQSAQAAAIADVKNKASDENVSNFEKHFGKAQPADIKAAALNADLAQVKPVGELNIAPMITAKNLRPENDPEKLEANVPVIEKDKDLAYLDDGIPQTEVKLMVGKPHSQANKTYKKEEDKTSDEKSVYSADTDSEDDIVVRSLDADVIPEGEIESAEENNDLDDYLDGDDDGDNSIGTPDFNANEISKPESVKKETVSDAEKPDSKEDEIRKAELKAQREKVFNEHMNAPAESEELTEHIESSPKEDFLKLSKPKETKPEKNEETDKKTDLPEQNQDEEDEDKKPSLLRKIRNKIFDAGETDSIYMIPVDEPETNKDSTKNFLDKIKVKLKNPEMTESREMAEFFSDISEEETKPEVPETENKSEKSEQPEKQDDDTQKSSEIQIAKKPGDKFEFDIIKGKNGEIRINSLVDPNGNPVPLDIKDGTAELRAKEEELAVEMKTNEIPETAEKKETAPVQIEAKDENNPQVQNNKKNRRKKKKNRNNKNSEKIAPAVDTGVKIAETAVKAEIAKDAAGAAAKLAESIAEAVPDKAAAETVRTETKKQTDEVKADKKAVNVEKTSDAKEKEEPEKLQETEKVSVKAEDKPEKVKAETADKSVPETEKNDEEVVSQKKDETKADVEDKPEETAKEKTDKVETEAAAEVPEIVFERDSEIVFEYPDMYFASSIEPKSGYLTTIPKLESVNADEYNSMIENVLSGKIDPPSVQQPALETEELPVQQTAAEEVQDNVQRTEQQKDTEEVKVHSEDTQNNTLDPFSPDSGEISLKELETKSDEKIGSKLKKSIGKLFVPADGEE